MKCPHCDYENGWSGELLENVEGSNGSFYFLPIDLERAVGWSTQRVGLLACPRCMKTFIDS